MPAEAAIAGRRCPYCGEINAPANVLCDNCGTTLRAMPAAGRPSAPLPPLPTTVTPETPSGEPRTPFSPPPPVIPPLPRASGPLPPTLQPAADAPPPFRPHLLVSGSTAPILLAANKAVLTLGRQDAPSDTHPDVDLTPHGGAEHGVSRQHARLHFQDEGATVEDLHSTNGTYVNGQRLTPGKPNRLQPGDELRLGRLRLVYQTH